VDFAQNFNVWGPVGLPSASSYPGSIGGVFPAAAWKPHDLKMQGLIDHYGNTSLKRQLLEAEIPAAIDVGTDVEVYWPGDGRYYGGHVAFMGGDGTYSIKYDDESKRPCNKNAPYFVSC